MLTDESGNRIEDSDKIIHGQAFLWKTRIGPISGRICTEKRRYSGMNYFLCQDVAPGANSAPESFGFKYSYLVSFSGLIGLNLIVFTDDIKKPVYLSSRQKLQELKG